MNNMIIALMLVEVAPVIYLTCKTLKVMMDALETLYNNMLDRCAVDIEYRNNIASMLFFFQDMGPNVSSFSIIAMFISSEENYTTLTVIFFVGIMVKELSRKLKNKFYSEIDVRSS